MRDYVVSHRKKKDFWDLIRKDVYVCGIVAQLPMKMVTAMKFKMYPGPTMQIYR